MTYQMCFVFTDSVMKKNPDVAGEIQIVRKSNLTPDLMGEYVPFAYCAIVGVTDSFGRTCETIESDDDTATIDGYTMVGVMPLPWESILKVGDNFTADNIYEVNQDGSGKREGFAKIEKLIICKTKRDVAEVVNKFAEINAEHGRPIKYAEQVMDDSVLSKAEQYNDTGYEAHLAKLAESMFPSQRNYSANV